MEMAKKVTVSFVDDLDGKTAADETVAFTLDGVAYEIDLSTKNAKKLRAALQPWIEAGRRVGGRRRSSIVGTSRITTEPRESAAIRVWARKHGYQVARRGRSQPTSWTPFGLLARQKHRSGGPLRHFRQRPITRELAPNVLWSWATETPDGVTSSRAGGSELRVAMSSDGT